MIFHLIRSECIRNVRPEKSPTLSFDSLSRDSPILSIWLLANNKLSKLTKSSKPSRCLIRLLFSHNVRNKFSFDKFSIFEMRFEYLSNVYVWVISQVLTNKETLASCSYLILQSSLLYFRISIVIPIMH